MKFSFKSRQQIFEEGQTKTFDLLVVGGGINGAGVARDAARRGLSVLCLEKGDLASGTSSRSSKLAHGGLRYLENLEFKLVFEALNERNRLLKMAPHLVHPLRFVIPMYEGDRVSPFKMKMGMILYDALSVFGSPQGHEFLNPEAAMTRVKSLKPEGLKGAFVYSDAYMDDDRLTIETARDAARFGAQFLTYCRVEALEPDSLAQPVKVIQAIDELTGESYKFKARHVISTSGPWTDRVAPTLLPDWKPRMRPTKGVHLTLNRMDFPIDDAVVMAADRQKRIIFAIPRQEMVVIGTTDTDFNQDPSDVKTLPEDVDYLLNIVSEYFPQAKLTKEKLVASYAGVRPLVDDGSGSESKISRNHVIISDIRGVTFLMGGKYTTYRVMCEDAVDEVLNHFPRIERKNFKKCSTKELVNPKINEESYAKALSRVDEIVKNTRLTHLQAKMLVERHGLEAWDMVEAQKFDYIWEYEAWHALEHGLCANLIDFYLRRVPLFLSQPEHGYKFLKRVSALFQEYYGWSNEQRESAEKSLFDHSKSELNWKGLTDLPSKDKITYI